MTTAEYAAGVLAKGQPFAAQLTYIALSLAKIAATSFTPPAAGERLRSYVASLPRA